MENRVEMGCWVAAMVLALVGLVACDDDDRGRCENSVDQVVCLEADGDCVCLELTLNCREKIVSNEPCAKPPNPGRCRDAAACEGMITESCPWGEGDLRRSLCD